MLCQRVLQKKKKKRRRKGAQYQAFFFFLKKTNFLTLDLLTHPPISHPASNSCGQLLYPLLVYDLQQTEGKHAQCGRVENKMNVSFLDETLQIVVPENNSERIKLFSTGQTML